MAREYIVNGPAILYVSTGSQGAPEELAVTETGVRINYKRFKIPIHTDISGPRMPAEFRDAGQIAVISGKMIGIDPDVLDKLRQQGDATSPGLLNTTGLLFGTQSASVGLWVDGTGDRPHYFPTVLLWEDEDELVGARNTEDDLSFFAWPFLGATALTSLDTPLFTYERPPGL